MAIMKKTLIVMAIKSVFGVKYEDVRGFADIRLQPIRWVRGPNIGKTIAANVIAMHEGIGGA